MKNIDDILKEATIGGSEIAAVMGLSRYATPLKLFAEKTGLVVREDISEKEWVELGTDLEDFVAQRFQRKSGKSVRRDSRTFTHPDYPYMVAHIDRRIVGTDEILECKTCSLRKEDEWKKDEVPIEYVLQCNWYSGILGKSKCWIAVLIGGQRFVYKELPYDAELFEKQVEAARIFYEVNLGQNIMPMAMANDGEVIELIHPRPTFKNILEAGPDDINDIHQLKAVKEQIRKLEKDELALESKIKQSIGEHEGIETTLYKVMWKLQVSSRLDFDRLRQDGVYEKYQKQVENRVLRISQKKEGQNG